MKEFFLIRHGQSYANLRDFTAFGNHESPLTEKGISQAIELRQTLRNNHAIESSHYVDTVAVSELVRAQQTAEHAGFKKVSIIPLINESDVDEEVMQGIDVISKHRSELWVPSETKSRARELYERIRDRDMRYEIYFTHGMFIAGFLLECAVQLVEIHKPFDSNRGYIPLLTEVVKVCI